MSALYLGHHLQYLTSNDWKNLKKKSPQLKENHLKETGKQGKWTGKKNGTGKETRMVPFKGNSHGRDSKTATTKAEFSMGKAWLIQSGSYIWQLCRVKSIKSELAFWCFLHQLSFKQVSSNQFFHVHLTFQLQSLNSSVTSGICIYWNTG